MHMTTKNVTIYIDSDASGLGPDATQDDLEQYAQNLATHIAERFPGDEWTELLGPAVESP